MIEVGDRFEIDIGRFLVSHGAIGAPGNSVQDDRAANNGYERKNVQ